MSLVFKKISYRNFLSTGNVPNSIELNTHASTLITGRNGEGKSTILCALTFALFGKPFRNIKKNQLINSINRKNCVVEIEFQVNGHEYKVVRGIKPNVFEIFCDGQLINQDAALKDYQKVLEQQILKLNFKTFTQVVILGSATFVPFMQLKSTERREVIEDILDIRIFSLMNVLLKDKASSTRDQIVAIESQIKSQKVKIDAQKKLIGALVSSKKDVIANLEGKIKANNSVIEDTAVAVNVQRAAVDALMEKRSRYEEVPSAIEKANQIKNRISTQIESCSDNLNFFHSNETCPSCSQPIAHEHKANITSDLSGKIEESNNKLVELESVLSKMTRQLEASNKLLDDIRTMNIETSALNNTISVLTRQNKELEDEIKTVEKDSGNIDEEKAKLKEVAEQAMGQVQQKSTLLDQRNLQEVASLLLKDTGIKTAIIKEYLPVMNKLINKYLSTMDFYVKFELDESFNETIKSRNRDEFTYDSFSEGEKQKINLAVLFAWRQIAKMKNSVNTNLLIMDEVLDSSLDAAGVDMMLTLIGDLSHTNTFIISHREVADKFNNIIKVEKRNDFSVILGSET